MDKEEKSLPIEIDVVNTLRDMARFISKIIIILVSFTISEMITRLDNYLKSKMEEK